MQGGEHETVKLFREFIKGVIRFGLIKTMPEEFESLCGLHYRYDSEGACNCTGSEYGVVFLDGERRVISPTSCLL